MINKVWTVDETIGCDREDEVQDADGTWFLVADFLDGYERGVVDTDVAYPHNIQMTNAQRGRLGQLYVPIYEDDVSHCNEIQRTEKLVALLNQMKGRFRLEMTACHEICVFGWWVEMERASFEYAEDMALFAGKAATVVDTSEYVSQLRYSKTEATEAKNAIHAACVAGTISTRSAAAFKAHVTRRVAA